MILEMWELDPLVTTAYNITSLHMADVHLRMSDTRYLLELATEWNMQRQTQNTKHWDIKENNLMLTDSIMSYLSAPINMYYISTRASI